MDLDLDTIPAELAALTEDQLLDFVAAIDAELSAAVDAPVTLALSARRVALTTARNRVVTAINTNRSTVAPAPVELVDATPETPAAADVAPAVAAATVATSAAELVDAAAIAAASDAPTLRDTRTAAAPRFVSLVQAGTELAPGDLGAAFAAGMGNRSGVSMVASFDRYAPGAARLGADASANHAILFGADSQELSVTAAICGPAEPVRESPVCVTADEPVLGALRDYPIQYGQIQVYAPVSLDALSGAVMIPAPDCEGDCGSTAPDMDCGTIGSQYCSPLPAVPAEPMSACVCVPESMMWSAEHVVTSTLSTLSAAFAAAKEQWRLSKIREQSFVRTVAPGLFSHRVATQQVIFQVLATLNNGQSGRFQADAGWQILIPRGNHYAEMADSAASAGVNVDGLLEDLVAKIGNATIVEYLDFDPTAPGSAPVGFTGALGNPKGANPDVALEGFYQTPSFYIFGADSFLTGGLGRTEWGLDATDRAVIESGCRKMIVREWNMPPVKFGCAPSVVVDFQEVGVNGRFSRGVDPAV